MMDTVPNPSTTMGTSEGSGGSGGVGGVTSVSTALVVAEDASARAAHKRYEALVMVKNKAIKGKGAWYWAHLEPVLIHSADTGLPKAVKLRCALCDAMFSASNPSRTASEHLKRGTCPNFSSPAAAAGANPSSTSSASGPKPLASIAPCSSALPSHHHHHHHHHSSGGRKRSSSSTVASPSSPYHVTPLALLDPYSSSCTPAPPQWSAPMAPATSQQLVLSGGKEDLGALAMLEDRVKKLKSPKASPGPVLSKAQIESALSLLSEWVHECCAAVSFTAISHPKFLQFLNQVGLPSAGGDTGVHPRDLIGCRLDARYHEALLDAEARLQDSAFFQLASQGWQPQSSNQNSLITLAANLPNGTTVFRKALISSACPPSKYAEEFLWEAAGLSSAGNPQRCAGIVADRFKSKALRDLEAQHQWLVNIPCQLQALRSLLKDFARVLPVVISVAAACFRITSFFNSNTRARAVFRKYQLQELDHSNLLLCAATDTADHEAVFAMLDDVVINARPLRLAVHDDSYKVLPLEEPSSREIADRIRDARFWAELEAVYSLNKLITSMATELELERPLIGQCLPLWEDLRAKLKEWCSKYKMDYVAVEKVIDRKFKKNYHPAWAAAFILDPLYLVKDSSGKYLPPFKLLSPEQEKDVDKLIMRLVSREEAHIALMELMKWRSEGLDPFYAQAVQEKKPDPVSGKMRIAYPQSSRLVWENYLSEFKLLGKVAVRLIFLHATACGFKCNSALIRWATAVHGPSRAAALEQAEKLVFVAAQAKFVAQAKLDRRDFSSEEEKDAELLASAAAAAPEGDDVLKEPAFVDA